MNKQDIIKKYSGKLFGTCDYKRDGNYYTEEFLNKEKLIEFLYGLETHEHSLTKSGFKFLNDYYGLDHLAEMLLEENPTYPYDNRQEIIDWLKDKNEFAINDEELGI